jgi:preprotein translocase subunit SecE
MMAEKDKIEKKTVKGSRTQQNFMQKIAALAVRMWKKLKNFFINLKAELKRVVWPDKKRLIQNTATVLAICVIAGLILFLVDSLLGGILDGIGFYAPKSTTVQTTATTAATVTTDTTATGATTAATTGTTASSGTTAGTTASK